VSSKRALRLFFLWHFHQPWYVEFGAASARLPWVRLHALKDYVDLPGLLAEEPRVPHAANLVPSLLDQLDLLSNGGSDLFRDAARTPVADWDGKTIEFVVAGFFSVHPRRMALFPRYQELLSRRDRLRADELRDLVVLFHLAWCGETLLKDPLVARLRKRGRRFSEAEKTALLDRQDAFVKEVLPAWRKAFASGHVEAATSPYHHPILPLLVDSDAGRDAVPHLPLPSPPFRHREDARDQIARGQATFERHFGFRPAGMWPPEGAISTPVLRELHRAGVGWVASDEDVLLQSLGAATREFGPGDKARTVFRPYRLASEDSPALFFRDRLLSDRIGFSYATWNADEAAEDFVARLRSIRDAAPEADLVVPVILDGENAWETYPQNGAPFLRALTAALAAASDLEVTTPSRVLLDTEPIALDGVVAGSWIGADLTTWIGAPAKNRAWTLLTTAREALAKEPAAREALHAAEASDWFWWFGDDHTSAEDPVFDELFRSHLAAAYLAAGREVPAELGKPVEERKSDVVLVKPVQPTIDGARPDYFEWLGAGRATTHAKGAMARGVGELKEVFFSASAEGSTLYFRVDAAVRSRLAGKRVKLEIDGSKARILTLAAGVRKVGGVTIGVDRIIEIAVPARESPVSFRIALLDEKGRELDAIPHEGRIRFALAPRDWSA